MLLRFRPFSASFAAGVFLLAFSSFMTGQHAAPVPSLAAAAAPAADEIPDSHAPRIELAAAELTQAPQTQAAQPQAPAATPAQSTAAQGSSSSQAPAPQPGAEKTKREKAAEQIKEQEKQRVLGVVPSFNVSYRSDAVSLSAGQKINLAFHSAVDPFTFAAGFLVAGYHEVLDDAPGFPWGIKGYGERSGAAYLDAFNGAMIGNGIMPAIFHQDPRYFRLGHGTIRHRLLYAASTSYICKHDNSGRWEPNYSNVGGNIIAGAISNLYYPAASRSGLELTFSNGFIVTTEGTVGGIFQEFWPDVSRRFLHKDPTRGLDAQARAQDAADKQARKQQSLQ